MKYIKTERAQQRGYSPAVISEGGRIVWLAGQTGTTDDQGKSLAGDFEGQARQIFKAFDTTLKKAGGTLADMVQMTVFVTDVRYGERLWQVRKDIFGDNFPGSAMVTSRGLGKSRRKDRNSRLRRDRKQVGPVGDLARGWAEDPSLPLWQASRNCILAFASRSHANSRVEKP